MKLFVDTQTLVWLYCSNNNYIRDRITTIKEHDKLFIHYHSILEFKNVVKNSKYFMNIIKNKIEEKFNKMIFEDGYLFDVMREPFEAKYKCRDRSDEFLLNFAIKYGYDGIISNDKDLLVLKNKIPNFKIVSVDERLQEISDSKII